MNSKNANVENKCKLHRRTTYIGQNRTALESLICQTVDTNMATCCLVFPYIIICAHFPQTPYAIKPSLDVN